MRILFTLLGLIASVGCAQAQVSHGPNPGTPHGCQVAINRLSADPHSAAFRSALIEGRLHTCGAAGAQATADVLRRLRTSTDDGLLNFLIYPASYNRHSAVLDAALDVAADPQASIDSRALALLIAMRQHNVTIAFAGGIGTLLNDPPGKGCLPAAVFGAAYVSQAPLPADYRQRIEAVASRIASDPGDPPPLKKFAGCTLTLIQGPSYEDVQRAAAAFMNDSTL
jgi:hypothetical protein